MVDLAIQKLFRTFEDFFEIDETDPNLIAVFLFEVMPYPQNVLGTSFCLMGLYRFDKRYDWNFQKPFSI